MLTFDDYARPDSAAAAWTLLQEPDSALIAGGLYLRLANSRLARLISLDGCGLDTISRSDGRIRISAMVSERAIETDPALHSATGGLLNKAVRHIMGVQVRNMATIGGSVWGRYGFSDLLTALLALDATIHLHKGGEHSLERFLNVRRSGKFVRGQKAVTITVGPVKPGWQDQRLTATDFPALNAAAVRTTSGWRIAVGSRPGRAVLCPDAMTFLDNADDPAGAAAEAGRRAAAELEFGSDLHGSAAYRKEIAPVLVERAIREALL